MAKLELPIRAFVEDFCKQAFPNRDFSRGSAINDLVIKAFSAILQPIRHDIDTIKVNQSVSNWQVMSQSALDSLAANWGKFRQTGARSTGQVRLYFETAADYQLNYLELYSTDGVTFVLASPVSISATELLRSRRQDGTFVYDVTVVSTGMGNRYAAPAGTVIGINNPPAGVIRCENLEDFVVTAPDESNFDVVNSMYRNLGLRNLVSRQSIRAPIFEQFPGVLDVYIAGNDSEKMVRDRLSFTMDGKTVEARLGAAADIWVNTTGVVARQVQFAYTPITQTFKLVSEAQAYATELLYSAPYIYYTMEGEYCAPSYLTSAYQLDESAQITFDQGGLSSNALVVSPKHNDRYQLAVRDLILGDSSFILPSRYSTASLYVTDVLGIPFDTVQGQNGDLIIRDNTTHRATQVSPRVLELAPGVTPESTGAAATLFTYPANYPAISAGARAITHNYVRTQLLPGGATIVDPDLPFYPGARVTIVGSPAAGQYRLLEWSDETGDPSGTTSPTDQYPLSSFFIGNVLSRGSLSLVADPTLPPNYAKYAYTGTLPVDVDANCWVYCHNGADPGCYDPRDSSIHGVGEYRRIINIQRSATQVLLTFDQAATLVTDVTIVQGLKGDLTPGTPIYFEQDGIAALPSSSPVPFAEMNTRYVNLTSVDIPAGSIRLSAPGVGAASTEGDLIVFEGQGLDTVDQALAGGDGAVQWTSAVARVVDADNVDLALGPPVLLAAGTAYAVQRNSEVVDVYSGTLLASLLATDTVVTATGIASPGFAQVGDRVIFASQTQVRINSTTQYTASLTTLGVFRHPDVGQTLAIGDVISIPSIPYTGTVTAALTDDTVQLGTNPVSQVNNGIAFTARRPGTFLQSHVVTVTDANTIVVAAPFRQAITAPTTVTVKRDALALTTLKLTAAAEGAIGVVASPMVFSGASFPLGLGDGSGLPIRITNPRTGITTYRTIRFSTGGSVKNLQMQDAKPVIPLVMGTTDYQAATVADIGQPVTQRIPYSPVFTGTTSGALPSNLVLSATGIGSASSEGDKVDFNISGTIYTAIIVAPASFSADSVTLGTKPVATLFSGVIGISGYLNTAGTFRQPSIGSTAQAGDFVDISVAGANYRGTVASIIDSSTVQLATPYPAYNIPSGTPFKLLRPTTPGTGVAYAVNHPQNALSFNGKLRSFDNAVYTWFVEPNDPAQDLFTNVSGNNITVSSSREANTVASLGTPQTVGYVAPQLGDVGKMVRQGAYSGVLTGFIGQAWEVKPLTENDLFDDMDSVTFVDYLGTGKVGARGYGNLIDAATTTVNHTAGDTALTLDSGFPFDILPVPTSDLPDATTACVVEVLSRNGRTGAFVDSAAAKVAPYAYLNANDWTDIATADEQILVPQTQAIGSYAVTSPSLYSALLNPTIPAQYVRLPNVVKDQTVTVSTYQPAGITSVIFPGSSIGVWGHQGRLLKLVVNGQEYFHTISAPNTADGVTLVATEPTVVPLDPGTTITAEVVDGFVLPYLRLLTAGIKAYRLVRAPQISEELALPAVGRNGSTSEITDQLTDGLQHFGTVMGGTDATGLNHDLFINLDSGPDASLRSMPVDSLISDTIVQLEPGNILTTANGVQYRMVRRPGWVESELWLAGTVATASTITVTKASMPAGWSWTRNGTFRQMSLQVLRDGSKAGYDTTNWEIVHLPVSGIITHPSDSTLWQITLDAANTNGLHAHTGVFAPTTGFNANWFSAGVRLMLRVTDRVSVRNVRANGIETYNYYQGQKFALPVIRVLAVEGIDGATQQSTGPLDYQFVVTDAGMRYSAREMNKLVITTPDMHLKPIRVTYLCDGTIEAIDNFVNNSDVRVLNCNQVVKRMETIAVDLQMAVKSTKTTAELNQLLASYINTLPSTSRISKDGIIQFLYAQGAVVYIDVASMRLDGYYYPAENGVPVEYLDVTDVFGAATAAYLAGNISVTKVTE
jgi:hypothetical protein